jgi:hypothetical protein
MSQEVTLTSAAISLGSIKKSYIKWGVNFLKHSLNNTPYNIVLLTNKVESFSEFQNNARVKLVDVGDKYILKSERTKSIWMHIKLHAINEALMSFDSKFIIYCDVDTFPNSNFDSETVKNFFNHESMKAVDCFFCRIGKATGDKNWDPVVKPLNWTPSRYPIPMETNLVFRVSDKLNKFIETWKKIEKLTPKSHTTFRIGYPIAISMQEANMTFFAYDQRRKWGIENYTDFWNLHNLGFVCNFFGSPVTGIGSLPPEELM